MTSSETSRKIARTRSSNCSSLNIEKSMNAINRRSLGTASRRNLSLSSTFDQDASDRTSERSYSCYRPAFGNLVEVTLREFAQERVVRDAVDHCRECHCLPPQASKHMTCQVSCDPTFNVLSRESPSGDVRHRHDCEEVSTLLGELPPLT